MSAAWGPASGSGAPLRPTEHDERDRRWRRVLAEVEERFERGDDLNVVAVATAVDVPRGWLYRHRALADHVLLAARSDVLPDAPAPPGHATAVAEPARRRPAARGLPPGRPLTDEPVHRPAPPGSDGSWAPAPASRRSAPRSSTPRSSTRRRPARTPTASESPARSRTGGIAATRPLLAWLEGSGVVVPVVGVSGGVGASIVATALFDVCDGAGRRTVLVDGADPSRSGLAQAGRRSARGRSITGGAVLDTSARGRSGSIHRLAPDGQEYRARTVPAAAQWFPDGTGADVTVVDVGWDPWTGVTGPWEGPGSWLAVAPGIPEELRPCPVLVCAPTRPSVAQAGNLLARWQAWTRSDLLAEVLALVVSGAPRWPHAVKGVAGHDVSSLDTFFVPRQRRLARVGIGPTALPAKIQHAAGRLAREWGLT